MARGKTGTALLTLAYLSAIVAALAYVAWGPRLAGQPAPDPNVLGFFVLAAAATSFGFLTLMLTLGVDKPNRPVVLFMAEQSVGLFVLGGAPLAFGAMRGVPMFDGLQPVVVDGASGDVWPLLRGGMFGFLVYLELVVAGRCLDAFLTWGTRAYGTFRVPAFFAVYLVLNALVIAALVMAPTPSAYYLGLLWFVAASVSQFFHWLAKTGGERGRAPKLSWANLNDAWRRWKGSEEGQKRAKGDPSESVPDG